MLVDDTSCSLPSWICQFDCAASWERVEELYENVFSADRSWLSFSCMYQIFTFQPSTATARSVHAFVSVVDFHLTSFLLRNCCPAMIVK